MEFEKALDNYRDKVSENLAKLKKAVTIASRLRKAVDLGSIKDINKYYAELNSAVDSVITARSNLDNFQFDILSYLSSPSGFHKDLLSAAEDEKLPFKKSSEDDRYFCYPTTLSINRKDLSLLIGKKKVTFLRPSAIVSYFKRLRSNKNSSNYKKLIDSLFECHEYAGKKLCSSDSLTTYSPDLQIPLSTIYDILTIMPGSKREYTDLDFAKDIHEMVNDPTLRTSKGLCMKCPPASAGSRGQTKSISLVTRDGHEMRYTYLQFVNPTR